MIGRGKARAVAWLVGASGLALTSPPVLAQSAAPAPSAQPDQLDPSAPLDPMPDLGVDWPDLQSTDTAPTTAQPDAAKPTTDVAGAELHYTVAVEGLDRIADALLLLAEFRKQSVLEAN